MGIPKTIKIGDGVNGKTEYYYWSEYETHEEAIHYAKKVKKEKKQEGVRVRYFVLEAQDSWFLPVPKFVVYFNRRLRVI